MPAKFQFHLVHDADARHGRPGQVMVDHDGPLFDSLAERFARDSLFCAAVLDLAAEKNPALVSDLPFNSSAPREQLGEPALSIAPTVTDLGAPQALANISTGFRDHQLFWVTLTGKPNQDVRSYLPNFLSAFAGAWGSVEARRDGSLHAHALVLLNPSQRAEEALQTWCTLTGAELVGQDARLVSGWRDFARVGEPSALVRNLVKIMRYASKRPLEAFAVGAFESVTLASYVGSTMTARDPVCLCGCGKTPAPGRKYLSGNCGDRYRHRAARAKRSGAVTVKGDSSATMTGGNS